MPTTLLRGVITAILIVFTQCIGYGQSFQSVEIKSIIQDTALIRQQINYGRKLQKTNPDSARILLQQTLQASTNAVFLPGITWSLISLGDISAEKGQYQQALAYYSAAGLYSIRLGKVEAAKFLAIIYNNMGGIYEYQGDIKTAAKYLYQVAALSQSGPHINQESLAGVYTNLAMILIQLRRPAQAMTYLNKAEIIGKKLGRALLLGNIYNNKGTCYIDQNDFYYSKYYFKLELKLGQDSSLLQLQRSALMGLGSIFLAMNKPDSALICFQRAIVIKNDVNPFYRLTTQHLTAQAYIQLRDYTKAEKTLLNASKYADSFNLARQKVDLYQALYEVYMASGQYKQALTNHVLYTRLKDSLESISIQENINSQEIKYHIADKDKQIAQQQLFITRQQTKIFKKNFLIYGISAIATLIIVITIALYAYRRRLQERKIQTLNQMQEIIALKAMVQGEENERTRIAYELHDGINGTLAAIKMKFAVLQGHYSDPANDDFNDIMHMLTDTYKEVRETAHNLMPDILLRYGLTEALKLYCAKINASNQLYINLQINGDYTDIEKAFELALYRIVQELIQNILKHSEASNALIQISKTDTAILVVVKDNGKGFDSKESGNNKSLQSTIYRTHSQGGKIDIQSAASKGTFISITFDI